MDPKIKFTTKEGWNKKEISLVVTVSFLLVAIVVLIILGATIWWKPPIGCRTDKDCPSDSICDNSSCIAGGCRSDSQCPYPYRCLQNGCKCLQDSDCTTYFGEDSHCNISTGKCETPASNQCNNDNPCPSGYQCNSEYRCEKIPKTCRHSGSLCNNKTICLDGTCTKCDENLHCPKNYDCTSAGQCVKSSRPCKNYLYAGQCEDDKNSNRYVCCPKSYVLSCPRQGTGEYDNKGGIDYGGTGSSHCIKGGEMCQANFCYKNPQNPYQIGTPCPCGEPL